MSGAQFVMTFGALLMPMWSADSWDSMKTQVMHFCWQIRPEPNIAPILYMSGLSHTICAPWVGGNILGVEVQLLARCNGFAINKKISQGWGETNGG